jgi:hypothetical protein
MTTEFTINFGNLDRTFNADRGWPNARTVLQLEAVLTAQFQSTQRQVHVRTQSLRRSGDHYGEVHATSWSGVIRYGGPSPGSRHDPVKYARYELNRGKKLPAGATLTGTGSADHDFMRATRSRHFRKRYTEVILAHLRGET